VIGCDKSCLPKKQCPCFLQWLDVSDDVATRGGAFLSGRLICDEMSAASFVPLTGRFMRSQCDENILKHYKPCANLFSTREPDLTFSARLISNV